MGTFDSTSPNRLGTRLDTSNVVALGANPSTTQVVEGSGPAINASLLAGNQMALQGAQQDQMRSQTQGIDLDNAFKAGVLKGHVEATNAVNNTTTAVQPSTADRVIAQNNADKSVANVVGAKAEGAFPLAGTVGSTAADAEIAANKAGAVTSNYTKALYQAYIDAGLAPADAASRVAQAGNITDEATFNRALLAAKTLAGIPQKTAAADASGLNLSNAANNTNLTVLGSDMVQGAAKQGVAPSTVQGVVGRPGAIAYNPTGNIQGADAAGLFGNVMGLRAALPPDTAAIAPTKEETAAQDNYRSLAGGDPQLQAIIGTAMDNNGYVSGKAAWNQDAANDLLTKSSYEDTRKLASGENRESFSPSTLTGGKGGAALNRAIADQNNRAADAVSASIADAGARYRAPAAVRGKVASDINNLFDPMFTAVKGENGSYKVNAGSLAPAQRASLISLVEAADSGDAAAPEKIRTLLSQGLLGKPSAWLTADSKGLLVPTPEGKQKLTALSNKLSDLKKAGSASALGGVQVKRDVANAIFGPMNVAPAQR